MDLSPAVLFSFLLVLCVFEVRSENVCPEGEKLCAEGCIAEGHKCVRELCPYPKIECKDRRKCYFKEDRCNKKDDCLDRSDEYGCDRTTPSPYYYDTNKTKDTGPVGKKPLFQRWPGILLITVVIIIGTIILIGVCIYWTLKCRLLHDQIAYDEKHKFMEEHGEMPSAGPVISGIRPPQDGWKYVTKSAYMLEDKDGKILVTDDSETRLVNNVKDAPKIVGPDTISETDEKEDSASPGSPEPPAYEDAVDYQPADASEIIDEESCMENPNA